MIETAGQVSASTAHLDSSQMRSMAWSAGDGRGIRSRTRPACAARPEASLRVVIGAVP